MPSSGFQTCALDRKSTRLNSSHTIISYAVFCLKKKLPRDARPGFPAVKMVVVFEGAKHQDPDPLDFGRRKIRPRLEEVFFFNKAPPPDLSPPPHHHPHRI